MTTIYSKAGTDAAISAATDALTPEDVGADPAGAAAAAIAALGLGTAAQSDATDFAPASSAAYPVQQVTLTGSLAYTLPVDAPADQVIPVVFTQDGTGGHTVTYDGDAVTVDLTAGASTVVEFWPVGAGYEVRYQVAPTAAGLAVINAASATAQRTVLDVPGRTDLGLAFALDSVTETATNPGVIVAGSIAGVAYGRHSVSGGLWRSADDGVTWEQITGAPTVYGGIHATGDGEVIVNANGTLRKSTGWATNPNTATWSTVCTANGTSAFIACDVDTHAHLVIAGEYGTYADAQNVWLSTDYGQTFTSVLNLDVLYPGQGASTHWHAVCIDPWHTGPNPRLWASHGDGPRGVYYSDDLGASWTLYANDWQPMPMIATPNGIVTSTDQNSPDGVWLIPRNLGARQCLHKIREPFWQAALLGFGISSIRDEATGTVYLLFLANQFSYFTRGVPARIFASDGHRAAEIYQTANTATVGVTGAINWDGRPALTASGRLLATYSIGTNRWTVSGRAKMAAPTREALDKGNALGGVATSRNAIAIGARTVARNQNVIIGSNAGATLADAADKVVLVGEEANGAHSTTAVGYGATGAQHSTVLGNLASSAGDDSVAIGSGATAPGALAVSMGRSAVAGVAGGQGGVAIGSAASSAGGAAAVGRGASATAADAIAVGGWAAATGGGSIAIGDVGTDATGTSAVAVGRGAKATHTDSVALGKDAATTTYNQLALGLRHIEMQELTDRDAPATNAARIYIRDNGAGKTQLCVRFATGAVQVIATEP